MKAAIPINKDEVCDLLVDDEEVICVNRNDQRHTRSVNEMPYATVKYFLADENTIFFHVKKIKAQ